MSDDIEQSWYRRWLATDPLIPGIAHVAVFSGGAILGRFAFEIAIPLVMLYVVLAVGINIGSTLERREHATDAGGGGQ